MKPGKEYFCGKYESQLMITEEEPDSFSWCRPGEDSNRGRYARLKVAR